MRDKSKEISVSTFLETYRTILTRPTLPIETSQWVVGCREAGRDPGGALAQHGSAEGHGPVSTLWTRAQDRQLWARDATALKGYAG